ncbi:hypothetical protein GCM10023081_42210 [Arthrobacter ginkgonis]|uniref:Uncharacterized protein n=2 Tax=Arthrobacter ginkgonis TaxID=1630594 RepID=A0ABP7D9Q2_9MICC
MVWCNTAPDKSNERSPMGYPIPSAGAEANCTLFGRGHRLHLRTVAGALRDATAWERITSVDVDVAEQAVRMVTFCGEQVLAYTHDALALAEHARLLDSLGRTGRRAEPVWNPEAGVLGMPADPRRQAGRSYLSLSLEPLVPCPLDHDPELERFFNAVTADFAEFDAV